MTVAEDQENLENLHALCSLIQTIREGFNLADRFDYALTLWISVMLNDHSMYEHILEDDIFFGVVGMLECNVLSHI